jgi:hypothetical protein
MIHQAAAVRGLKRVDSGQSTHIGHFMRIANGDIRLRQRTRDKVKHMRALTHQIGRENTPALIIRSDNVDLGMVFSFQISKS